MSDAGASITRNLGAPVTAEPGFIVFSSIHANLTRDPDTGTDSRGTFE